MSLFQQKGMIIVIEGIIGVGKYANFLLDVLKSDECVKIYEMGKELDCLDCIYNLGVYYRKMNDPRYMDYFLIAAEKNDSKSADMVVDIYYTEKNDELYEKYLLKYLHLFPNKYANNLAMFYEDRKKFDLAEKYYLQAVNLDDESAMYNLGRYYQSQKRFSEMKKLYKRAIVKNETYSMYSLAYYYYRLGRYGKAKKYFKMYVHHSDECDGYNGLGNTYYQLGKYEKMRQNYNVAINRNYSPSMVEYADFLALTHLPNQPENRPENVMKYIQMAIDLGNITAMSRMGKIYEEKKDFVNAEKYFNMMVEHNSHRGYVRLAELAYIQEQYDLMVKNYELAIKNNVQVEINIPSSNVEAAIILTDMCLKNKIQLEYALTTFMSNIYQKLSDNLIEKYNKVLKNILMEDFNLKFRKLSVSKPVFKGFQDVKFE